MLNPLIVAVGGKVVNTVMVVEKWKSCDGCSGKKVVNPVMVVVVEKG